MKTKKRNKGFTLIELLVVVAVIAILGTVAVTAYIGTTLKASRSEAYSNLSALKMFQDSFFAERARYSTNQADFPGFEPWQAGTFTEYTYAVIGTGIALTPPVSIPYDFTTAAAANCFVATATGNPGTRAAGDIFAIDCNGVTNY
jgi:prepilin-type N-terminal cleavage/methylation domain-containing protein